MPLILFLRRGEGRGEARDLRLDVFTDGQRLFVLSEDDLVVVGAGISGLSAAHFYRREHPGARVLVLDNHDDFGGHAKRNEFEITLDPTASEMAVKELAPAGDFSVLLDEYGEIWVLKPTGVRPRFMDEIEAADIRLPASIFGLGDRLRY